MTRIDIYPFHRNDRFTYAWVFRRDESGRPVLRSLRLRRYPNRIVLIIKPDEEDSDD